MFESQNSHLGRVKKTFFGKSLWIRFEHKDERSLQVKYKEGQDPGEKVEDSDLIQLLCTDYKIMSNILKSMLK